MTRVAALLAPIVLGLAGILPASTGGLLTEGLDGVGAPMPPLASAFTLLGAHTAEQALDNLAAAGVQAIRQDFLWQRIEPSKGTYVFDAENALVNAAAERGIDVIAILAYGNPLYSRVGAAAGALGTGGGIPPFGIGAQYLWPPEPEHLGAYRAFAKALAQHFKGRVHRYEVWNEENVGWRFWPPREDPAAYAALLRAGAEGLREGDPSALVSLGGLFYPEIPPGVPEEGGRRYLGHVYDADPGIGATIDAVAWHPYPYPFVAPEVVLPGNSSVPGSADQMRELIRLREGGQDELLWVTEIGWPTHREYGVSPERQAAYLARSFALLWAEGVELVTWYTYSDGPNAEHNQEDAFGLFTFGGSPKPSYRALRTFASTLSDTTLSGERTDLGARALVFDRADATKRVTMVWTAPETLFTGYGSSEAPDDARAVSMPVAGGVAVTLVHSTGCAAPLTPDGGVVTFEASFDPVYVVEGALALPPCETSASSR